MTQHVIADAIDVGVKHIWMQPGAEHEQTSESARKVGINVIDEDDNKFIEAAILGTAIIITYNLRDFSQRDLTQYG